MGYRSYGPTSHVKSNICVSHFLFSRKREYSTATLLFSIWPIRPFLHSRPIKQHTITIPSYVENRIFNIRMRYFLFSRKREYSTATAGFTIFPSFVAQVQKYTYVDQYLSCRRSLSRSPGTKIIWKFSYSIFRPINSNLRKLQTRNIEYGLREHFIK